MSQRTLLGVAHCSQVVAGPRGQITWADNVQIGAWAQGAAVVASSITHETLCLCRTWLPSSVAAHIQCVKKSSNPTQIY
jgi:hypothetical protein